MVMPAAAVAAGNGLWRVAPARSVTQLLEDRRIDALSALHLKGGMADMEALEEEPFYPAEHFRLVPPLLRGQIQMSRKCDDVGTDGPEIEMMDVVDTGHALDRISHLGRAHAARHTLKENMRRIAYHPPRAPEDDSAYSGRNDRIKDVPSGEVDYCSAGYHPY